MHTYFYSILFIVFICSVFFVFFVCLVFLGAGLFVLVYFLVAEACSEEGEVS